MKKEKLIPVACIEMDILFDVLEQKNKNETGLQMFSNGIVFMFQKNIK